MGYGRISAAVAAAGVALSVGAMPAAASPLAARAGALAVPAGCSGTSVVSCHFAASPGNYDVTVTIGDAASAGNTSMSVEARRLLMPATDTAAGSTITATFTVNVRQPEGQPTGQGGTGTAGLDIRFAGSAPRVSAVSFRPAANPLVVYLAGDSTVCDQPSNPYTGWGQMITAHVGAGAVVANYGDSGESSGSFLSNSALFPAMQPLIKTNDLVLIQFGHNDKQTAAATFRTNLTTMINRVRARGGVPVLVTPPVRRLFSGNQLTPTALHVNGVGANLPVEMRAVGSAQDVPVIDLTAKSKALVESMGPNDSATLFLRSSTDGVSDNTHFSETGGARMGDLVLDGIRERNLSLVRFLH